MRLLKVLSVLSALTLIAACETASTEGAAKSGTGAAPATAGTTMAPAMTLSSELAQVGDRVFFDYDKYNLKPQGRATVEKQAALLKKYPNAAVTVEGHCDERGTREYNLALGERRANAVKDYLVALGIPAARIKTISYGKERPAALGSTEAAWAQNRRAVSIASGPGA
ncbi:MAG: peptidoglycan-associated lipoprotein Pal [Rhodospirillales bacterium]|nr:peptidoglycan-associated lipoprotein Pal [Rhodospirillales bacterium]